MRSTELSPHKNQASDSLILLYLVFLEIEFPYPQSEKDKGYSAHGQLPVGLVDGVHEEAHYPTNDEKAADNLVRFHDYELIRLSIMMFSQRTQIIRHIAEFSQHRRIAEIAGRWIMPVV